jgi:hypothetical protein
MTINMGGPENGPANGMLGSRGELWVTAIGIDNRVLAVAVETEIPSKNAQKHVTIAVNRRDGGKPVHSNELDFVYPDSDLRRSELYKNPLHGTVQ